MQLDIYNNTRSVPVSPPGGQLHKYRKQSVIGIADNVPNSTRNKNRPGVGNPVDNIPLTSPKLLTTLQSSQRSDSKNGGNRYA